MTSQLEQIKMQCQQCINQAVHVEVNGQHGYNGVVEHVDDEYVYLMVPVDENGQYLDLATMNMNAMHPNGANQAVQPMMRQQMGARYPYNPYFSPYPFYPYPPRPFGWNRLVLPLAALTALAIL
ncbi:hypothetical protein [Halalkalibacter oceani]|uniref:Uncharacterized protein n=1 Tax=Halalkalibacter oceani TaxID=1653776 RepID=A0A9X2IMD7_9BACI|nr:hypothetical protein [Halalkalibacter oceani]MCM3712626.1 hypothetical protein [Halalkalibacter oceani]MCM3762616.1 hypothetical protein [Halalkalibacter oceani]